MDAVHLVLNPISESDFEKGLLGRNKKLPIMQYCLSIECSLSFGQMNIDY